MHIGARLESAFPTENQNFRSSRSIIFAGFMSCIVPNDDELNPIFHTTRSRRLVSCAGHPSFVDFMCRCVGTVYGGAGQSCAIIPNAFHATTCSTDRDQ